MFRINSGGFTVDQAIVRVNAPSPTVTIGSQIWTNTNLDVTTYRNGDPIPEITGSVAWNDIYYSPTGSFGAWCYYNNDPANGPIYGKLYNWWAITDTRGIGPEGFHVPTYNEVLTLRDFLGGSTLAGGRMKTTGTTIWNSPNTGATNSSGFSGLPGSGRSTGGGPGASSFFFTPGNFAYFWTSTDAGGGGNVGWSYSLIVNSAALTILDITKGFGYSVRLIKD